MCTLNVVTLSWQPSARAQRPWCWGSGGEAEAVGEDRDMQADLGMGSEPMDSYLDGDTELQMDGGTDR